VLSIAGTNADYRGMIKPSEEANVVAYLLSKFGVSTSVSTKLSAQALKVADLAVEALKKTKGESLVVAGSNNVSVQILVNKLNAVLGTYKHTINTTQKVNLFASQDSAVSKFVSEVVSGKVPAAVFFHGVNPVYTLSNGETFGKAIEKIELSVSLSGYADETASKCKYICPDHHALEAWNDSVAKTNHFAIAQPTIRPLFNTSSVQESFLLWVGTQKIG